MRRHGAKVWWAALAATASVMASGCVCLFPAPPIPQEAVARCAALPQVCRNHVYIFLFCGQGPLDLGGMGDLRESLISLGYIKTYCGECCYSGYYKDEILRLRRQDESARFVVMGYGLGANTAAELTEAVRPGGATIDLLVYCGGLAISNEAKYRPANALRVVHLLNDGVDSLGTALEGADNIVVTDVTHFGTPTHPYTMELLVRELTEVASRVSVVGSSQPVEGKPALERDNMPRDDWDFLKPAPPTAQPPAPNMPKVL